MDGQTLARIGALVFDYLVRGSAPSTCASPRPSCHAHLSPPQVSWGPAINLRVTGSSFVLLVTLYIFDVSYWTSTLGVIARRLLLSLAGLTLILGAWAHGT